MKLYASLSSPFARKARILSLEKGLALPLVELDPGAADGPLVALNPLGKVPILERDDGSLLFDSPVIVEWLDGLGDPRLIPGSGEPRWQTLLWQALADGMMEATVNRMIEKRRPAAEQSAPAIARQEGKVSRALDWAHARISGEHLVGDSFSLADIALGSALDYLDLRYPHGWRARHPQLAGWHAALVRRPSFVETLPPGLVRPD